MSQSSEHQQACDETGDREPLWSEIVEMAEAERQRSARRFAVTHIKRGDRAPIVRDGQDAEQDVQSEINGHILMIKAQISALPPHDDPTKRVAWPTE